LFLFLIWSFLMKKFDVIIVGSGLGGLLCAYILSKEGYQVCVLEKNHQIGGCLQTFSREGICFDTGMHYIGSLDEGQILYKFFKYFGLLEKLQLAKLDENGFDKITLNNQHFNYAMGYEKFENSLKNDFPNDTHAITSYVNKIKEISKASPLYNLQEIGNNNLINTEYVKSSVTNYIQSLTPNITLQNVLTGTNPLYAGVKQKTPLYIHALINNFYIQSAWRIVNGSHQIAEILEQSIKANGGTVCTRSEVQQLLFENDQLKYAELTNGDRIEAKYFISNTHPVSTLKMLNTPLIRNIYRERINNLSNTISNFTLYLVFKKDTFRYLNYNHFYYSQNDAWSAAEYTQDDWPRNLLFMNQARTSKDEYADSALLIAYMHFDEVKKWENTTVGKRGNEYKEFKQKKAEILLKKIEELYPGINSCIKSYYTSSPLTYRDYTATKDGSMYGIMRDCNAPAQTIIGQRTKISNLFLTGQNINSHGILGVTIGAILTCAELMDINYIIKKINLA